MLCTDHVLPQNVLVTHHKDASAGCSGVAVGGGGADRLVVVGLLPLVEGFVEEGVHQGGVHLAEEHADLEQRPLSASTVAA